MIYDCFSFFNELDLLELRLRTLEDAVDRFVLAEATCTYTGKPKPLYFAENRQRFARWLDRIIYVLVDDLPEVPSGASDTEIAWVRENHQRNCLIRGLKGASHDDMVIVSDLDEIPDPEKIAELSRIIACPVRFRQRNYAYFLNYRDITVPSWMHGPVMIRYGELLTPGKYPPIEAYRPCLPAYANEGPSLTYLRFAATARDIGDAGWHFSFMGGMEMIKRKLVSFAHIEYSQATEAEIKRCLEEGRDVMGKGHRYVAEPISDRFPLPVVNGEFGSESLIMPTTAAKYRATWRLRLKEKLKRYFGHGIRGFLYEAMPLRVIVSIRRIKNRRISSPKNPIVEGV